MTVHFQQSLASVFHLQYSQLQDLYHLSSEKALLPAIKKALLELIPAEFAILSGHLIGDNATSPFIDLIIYPKKASVKEQIREWGLLYASDALCLIHRPCHEENELLSEFLTQNKASLREDLISLDLNDFLLGHAEEMFSQVVGLLGGELLQNERTLVRDKKIEKASQVAASVNGISIPYKEPLKKNTYTAQPQESEPEPEPSRKFNPGQPEGPEGHFPIHRAIIRGELPAVSEYLQMGGDPELKNKNGDTLLHLAAINNQVEIAELLLISEAEVNSRNYVYAAPLHLAVEKGLEDMLDLLTRYGAELEARNNRGKTPLHIAAIHGRKTCATRLLDKGADIHACMEKSMNPLHLAAWYGQSEIARRLIELGADINATNEDGNSALHFAAFNGQVKVIKILMVSGADPSIQNKAGETYLQGVNEGYSGEMIKVLD